MADNSIKRDPNLLYNNIEEQRLLYNNQLSLQDWNRIINELKTQANVNTKYLEQFIEWFMHGDAKYLELPTDESFVDYILDLLNYINSNYFHPDSTVEGEVVQAVPCETVELLPHDMEYSVGDTIPIATSTNYEGPRDKDIPTTQLVYNLIQQYKPTKVSQLQNDSIFITKTYADTKVPIINTLDGVRQPNISGKTNWNLWDTFVFTYSPNSKDSNGNLVYGGVPKLMKVSQGWDPDAKNSTEGLTIVQRTKNGTITTANPISDHDVVSLQYLKNYVEQNAGGVNEENLDQYLVDKGLYTYRENYVEYESYAENYPDADGWYWGTTKTYNLFIGDATDSTIKIITKDPEYANEKYIIDYNNETGVLTVQGATRLPYNLHTHLTVYYERGILSNVIKNTENKLKNYVSNYAYSKTAVDNKLSAIPKFAIEVVNDIHKLYNPSTTTVYLMPKENETNDLYEEWIYVNDTWELLGTAKVDLTDYAKIEQIPIKLSQLEQDVELGVSEEQVNSMIENAITRVLNEEV